MPEPIIAPRTYILVCIVLVLLTILTVGLSFAHVPPYGHILFGLSIGAVKAALVILFFMHALHSSRVTWLVIAIVIFWVGILFVLTLSDYWTRGMIPNMPGH